MLPGMDPRKMQALMRQMGLKTKNLPAKRVIIELENGELTIENPNVMEIEMQGMKTYQISGEVHANEFSQEDIKFIMEQTGASKEMAEKALKEANGDIAEAILKLKG